MISVCQGEREAPLRLSFAYHCSRSYDIFPFACAEDRATVETDPSADAGGYTDGQGQGSAFPF